MLLIKEDTSVSANTIDAALLAKMFLAGAKNLESKKDYINELNVFPVPDGDTGTNMTLTIMSAANDIHNMTEPDMSTLCKAMSSGSLRGARGNSGVILSQLLRGFTKAVKDKEELDISAICLGGEKAVETAYKAVMKPKEGTILTVAKGLSEKASELLTSGETDLKTFLEETIAYGYEVLAKTPDMLPVLKEAGVVDSGGQGLMEFLQGAFDVFCGKEVNYSAPTEAKSELKLRPAQEDLQIKFEYKVSYVILLSKNFNVKLEDDFRNYLENIGDEVSVAVQEQENTVKVSLVTNDPGFALQKGIKFGSITKIQVENQKKNYAPDHEKTDVSVIESINASKATEPVKPFGFISVSVGEGIGEIFKSLGTDSLIEGGQTMNPSTEDLLNAIAATNAETIFVLPNNKNIIMAANQARDMTEDKNVIVIPTKTVPQGISAIISFMPDASAEENENAMLEAIEMVKTGQVTYAVRDTVIEGTEIHQDDYMGIGDTGILSSGKEITSVVLAMVDKMTEDGVELISIYYGADISEQDAENIHSLLAEKYPEADIELQMGGQPVYYYIISVE